MIRPLRPVLPVLAIASVLLVLAGAATLMSVATARAEIAGDCDATIAGTDLSTVDSDKVDDAIDVDYDDVITTTMSSASGFESHKIKLRFLGAFERTVEDREDDGETSFTEEVDVSDYAWLGVGLYKVRGEANVVGGFACSGAALVNVTGRNPVTTVAGGVATAVVVVGTVGAAATGIASVRRPGGMVGMVEEAFGETRAQVEGTAQAGEPSMTAVEAINEPFWFASMFGCFCFAVISVLMLPLLALTGSSAGGASGSAPPAAPAAPRRRPRRVRWLPRITLVGLVSGALTGLAGVVLVQQFAIAYPTTELLIEFVLCGALVYGVVVPTLGYTIGWLGARGRGA